MASPLNPDCLLFVYGTLLKDVGHPMHAILAGSAAFVSTGRVRGRLYDLGPYPGITVEDCAPGFIQGELYALAPDSAADAWERLDGYERCRSTDPQPHEYCRQEVTVELTGGGKRTAWAYVLNGPPHAGAREVPSGDYLVWRKQTLGK